MDVHYRTFDDANLHAEALAGWDQRYDQIGRGAFRSFIKQAATEHVQVFQEAANLRVVQQGHLPAGRATFGLILRGDAPFSFQGIELDEAALIVTSGGRPFVLHSPPDMAMLGVSIDTHTLERTAADAGLDFRHSVMAQQVLNIPPLARIRAGERILAALDEVHATPAAQRSAALQARFTHEVTHSILDLLAFHMPRSNDRLTHACRADIVRRSHQLLLSRPEQPVSIVDLCRSLRVSRRTIQTSFRSVTQMNPLAYLRAVRLAQVRRLLSTTSQRDVPVGEAAARWGFANLGHFASDYRSQFGELPSHTARLR